MLKIFICYRSRDILDIVSSLHVYDAHTPLGYATYKTHLLQFMVGNSYVATYPHS